MALGQIINLSIREQDWEELQESKSKEFTMIDDTGKYLVKLKLIGVED